MNKMLIAMLARKYKNELKINRENSHATILEICMVINGFIFGDYNHVFGTNLYKNHGGEYCELLQIIHYDIDHDKNHHINKLHDLMLKL